MSFGCESIFHREESFDNHVEHIACRVVYRRKQDTSARPAIIDGDAFAGSAVIGNRITMSEIHLGAGSHPALAQSTVGAAGQY